ncbi:hypothetical protein CAG99_14015 [Streptomyces marincola]|uniref:ABC3 transporter permease C-terminal domain-containing protein n=2 Tax=Streptomyces marincola TaxID=2878388 RepID=A0A1W7D5I2_9ACTN|nr:hypothetical protein CAG99_14015 [Streptomyces marincola]
MIALPIVGVTAADIAFRSGEISRAEELTRLMGGSDAEFVRTVAGPIQQSPDNSESYTDDWDTPDERTPEDITGVLAGVLPPGTELRTNEMARGVVHSRSGLMSTTVREVEPGPHVEGMLTLLRGDFPGADDEVAATQAFLDDSGLHVGSRLRFEDGDTSYRITGAYELPGDLGADEVLARPGAVLPLSEEPFEVTYLADVPDGGVTWDMVMAANEHGLTATSKSVVADPPPDDQVPLFRELGRSEAWANDSPAVVAVAVVVVSLIVLEICLLAGPAFAVGARRSRRQLGLIGANGGDRRHLRAVMLAGGIVLGAAAAVIGLVLGTLLALAARPWIEERTGSRFGAWDFRVPELAGIALLAVLVGLLAAVVPAIGAARADVLESLTGRRGVRRAGRALPTVGVIAVVLGVPLTLVGGLMWNSAPAVAGGAILTELGLVALTPLLVGAFGRLGRWLPLTARLALRDAARNRGRTAPAVAAVLAAVAGAVSVATVIASDDAEARGEYVAQYPEGTVTVNAGGRDGENLELAARLAEQHLSVRTRADLSTLAPGPDGSALLVKPEGAECPLWEAEAESMTPAERRELQEDSRCAEGSAADMVAVAGPELLDVLNIGGPEARAALDRGDAVVLAEHLVADGRIEVAVFEEEAGYDESGGFIRPPDRTLALPAHVVEAEGMPLGYGAVVSPETARAAGTEALVVDQVLMSTTRTPTGEEEQALKGAFSDQLGEEAYVYVENGYKGDSSLGLLILSLAALVITLGAAGIATGLAQADSEADLRTLAAVGAAPRLRRALSGLQCGMVAAMGVFLGALSGLVPAVGIVLALHRDELDHWERGWDEGWGTLESRPELYLELPWGTFAQLIVVVPLVACLMAALLTRSRVPLARRAG